jgi:hypothetical protein
MRDRQAIFSHASQVQLDRGAPVPEHYGILTS